MMTIIAKNLGSSDIRRKPGYHKTKVATTLLARDWEGLSNYGSNAVIVWEIE